MSSQFVRMVSKSKWNNQLSGDKTKINVISADAITSCLRTKSNTLSIWSVSNIDDAILALASVKDNLVSIDFVVLTQDFFDNNGIEIKNVKAESNPVKDLQNNHYDIVNLEYNSLGVISQEIANKTVNDNNFIQRYSVKKVKEIINNAISNARLNKNDLSENIQKKL